MNTFTAALIQQTCGENRDANIARTVSMLREAAGRGARLAVLPELHTGRYFCQCADPAYFDWAESIPGPTTAVLSGIAKELKLVVVASLFERRAAGLYHNTAVVFDSNGDTAGLYRKMHIPDDPGFYEKFYFTPGEQGFRPIATSLGNLGVLICWDQWFPEAARLMTLAGAEVLIYPTAIGWNPQDLSDEQKRQRDAWTVAQRAHAVSNSVPVICVNRVGYEPDPTEATAGIEFWGTSFAAGPQGEVLVTAAADSEQMLLVEVDTSRTEEVRRIWPFLRDRRIDAYGGLESRYLDSLPASTTHDA